MSEQALKLPAGCQWLIRLASWIVPRPARSEWRRQWERDVGHWWAFLNERGDPWLGESRVEIVRHCWGAFPDAFWRRFRREDLLARFNRIARSPGFCLALTAMFLAMVAVASHGFSATRALLAPLPYRQAEQLVIGVRNSGLLGQRWGVPLATIELWKTRSTTTAGMAAYSLRTFRIGARSESILGAHVTSDFFTVLRVGTLLGRTFDGRDSTGVILSHQFWQKRFGAAAGIMGRTITLDGQPVPVIGVMQPEFWFPSPQVKIWTVLPPAKAPYLVPAVARLDHGVRKEQAQAELRRIASSAGPLHWSGTYVELESLAEASRGPLYLYRLAVLAMALVVVLAVFEAWSMPTSWRFWAFLFLKSSLLVAGLVTLWFELVILNPFAPATLFTWFYLLGCVGLLYAVCHDQKRRCPVCLYRLSMPVTIGSWGSHLFDPVSTELICQQGHGALYIPETGSSAGSPEHWTAMDESWRDLFVQ